MMRRLSLTFWVETALATLAAVIALLTVVWGDWVEAVSGFSPDHHDGSFELQLVLASALVAVTFSLLARRRWRQAVAG
jgi:hypothetical protein